MIQNEDSFKIRTCKQCLYFLIYKASRYIKKILLDLSITLENLINRGCWYTALISFGITLLLGICLMLHLKCIRRDTRANSVQTNPFLKSNPAAAALEKACTSTTLQAPRSAVLWQLRRAVHVSCSDSPSREYYVPLFEMHYSYWLLFEKSCQGKVIHKPFVRSSSLLHCQKQSAWTARSIHSYSNVCCATTANSWIM